MYLNNYTAKVSCTIIQIVTGIDVTIVLKADGNISPTEGKQFTIVTDYGSLYLFCYTSQEYKKI